MVIDQAAAAGVELEPQCVAEAVALLNEADLALMAAAATQSSPDATIPALSAEGEAIGESISDCVVTNGDVGDVADAATVAEAVAFVVSQEGEAMDQVCLTEQFSALGAEELRVLIDEGSTTDNPLAERPFMAVWECFVDEDTSSIDTTTPQEVVPMATEAQPVTAVETPMGWPAGVPVLASPDFYISADPTPPGQFDVIMRVQTPAIFQSEVDSWAASIGLGCIVDLQVTGAQPCTGALADGTHVVGAGRPGGAVLAQSSLLTVVRSAVNNDSADGQHGMSIRTRTMEPMGLQCTEPWRSSAMSSTNASAVGEGSRCSVTATVTLRLVLATRIRTSSPRIASQISSSPILAIAVRAGSAGTSRTATSRPTSALSATRQNR
jgi:hypothetical protein